MFMAQNSISSYIIYLFIAHTAELNMPTYNTPRLSLHVSRKFYLFSDQVIAFFSPSTSPFPFHLHTFQISLFIFRVGNGFVMFGK